MPLRRLGDPEEVAGAIAFLLGPASAYVHGQVLRVDGGLGLSAQALATGGPLARVAVRGVQLRAHGQALGIATLEDVLEEIVGQIEDEFDSGDAGVRHSLTTTASCCCTRRSSRSTQSTGRGGR